MIFATEASPARTGPGSSSASSPQTRNRWASRLKKTNNYWKWIEQGNLRTSTPQTPGSVFQVLGTNQHPGASTSGNDRVRCLEPGRSPCAQPRKLSLRPRRMGGRNMHTLLLTTVLCVHGYLGSRHGSGTAGSGLTPRRGFVADSPGRCRRPLPPGAAARNARPVRVRTQDFSDARASQHPPPLRPPPFRPENGPER